MKIWEAGGVSLRSVNVEWFEAIKALIPPLEQSDREALVSGLNHADDRVRSIVARRIGELLVVDAVDELIECVVDSMVESDKVTMSACWALGELGQRSDEVVEILERAANLPSKHVRVNAVEALGKLHSLGSIDVLRKAGGDRKFCVRLAAIKALEEIANREAIDGLRAISSTSNRRQTRNTANEALQRIQTG